MTDSKLGATFRPAGAKVGQPSQTATPDSVNSDSLFRGKGQVAIRHKNEVYILRQTRFGKLILTK